MRSSLLALLLLTTSTLAASPPPLAPLIDWPITFGPTALGTFSAQSELPTPTAKDGPLTVNNGHFFSGPNRVRLWGANLAFSASFPDHATADAAALRLAQLGFNAVRLHHMDNQPFPNGIWSDATLSTLSPEALDRLDYFIAALQNHGIWCDLNLHVSRDFARVNKFPNADLLPGYDKVVDLFYPPLIAAQKDYARMLLNHVNAYTHHRYADDPAIGIMEINNEDTIFLWNGKDVIENLPDPYATELQSQWNAWLLQKYHDRPTLEKAWQTGADPRGPELLQDPAINTLNAPNSPWIVEQHAPASMAATPLPNGVHLAITKTSTESWHLQFNQPNLTLKKGQFYSLRFTVKSTQNTTLIVGVGMAHEPWQNLGGEFSVKLKKGETKSCSFGFVANADDPNARLSFSVGSNLNQFDLTHISLTPGGRDGLLPDEDPAKNTVARLRGNPASTARDADWYAFLQHTDESFWTGMRDFLRTALGVKCPITGTIVLGPLGAIAQSKMDYVDTHAYWDHPQFPHRAWDMTDWKTSNEPMVDHPEKNALWNLAAGHVEGKPFTVTEYQNAAPNEWQAEGLPMIATYAATQDWDGIFIFAYAHSADMLSNKMQGFFNLEGNPLQVAMLPLASRAFLRGNIEHMPPGKIQSMALPALLPSAATYYARTHEYLTDHNITSQDLLTTRFSWRLDTTNVLDWLSFGEVPTWTTAGPYTGRYTLVDGNVITLVGFLPAGETTAGVFHLTAAAPTFVSAMVVPADSTKEIATADKLLVALIGRGGNSNMTWNPAHTMLTNWGNAPTQLELIPVTASLNLPGNWQIQSLDSTGQVLATTPGNSINIPTAKAVWFQWIKQK